MIMVLTAEKKGYFPIDDWHLMLLEKPNILGIPWKTLSVIKRWANISCVTIMATSDAHSDHEKH